MHMAVNCAAPLRGRCAGGLLNRSAPERNGGPGRQSMVGSLTPGRSLVLSRERERTYQATALAWATYCHPLSTQKKAAAAAPTIISVPNPPFSPSQSRPTAHGSSRRGSCPGTFGGTLPPGRSAPAVRLPPRWARRTGSAGGKAPRGQRLRPPPSSRCPCGTDCPCPPPAFQSWWGQ